MKLMRNVLADDIKDYRLFDRRKMLLKNLIEKIIPIHFTAQLLSSKIGIALKPKTR